MVPRDLFFIAMGLNSACFGIAGQTVKAVAFQYSMDTSGGDFYIVVALLKTKRYALDPNDRSFLDKGFFLRCQEGHAR